jgi:hypothetical protein
MDETPVPIPVASRWRHRRRTTNVYTVLVVANTQAEDADRYPVTVVYSDNKGVTWAKPVERFLAGMTRIPPTPVQLTLF